MSRPSTRSLLSLLVVMAAVSAGASWWRDHLAQGLGQDIARQARPGDILMLSSQTCVFCAQARRWLTAQRVPFGECVIELDPACAARYQALGAPGTPVMLVRGQAQLGFSPQQVQNRLASAAGAAPGASAPTPH
jgi:glutaredoxin